jgi:hypothetical protein
LQQPLGLSAALANEHVAQQLQQLGLSGSPPAAAAVATAGAAGGMHVMQGSTDDAAAAAAAAGGKCFMSALNELKVTRLEPACTGRKFAELMLSCGPNSTADDMMRHNFNVAV